MYFMRGVLLLGTGKDSQGEAFGCILSAKCVTEFVFEKIRIFVGFCHMVTSPMVRVTLSLGRASERCNWLLTVATGMARTAAMSSGNMSSW